MKRFLFAVAVIALFATAGVAQDKPVPTTPPAGTVDSNVTTGAAPVTSYVPATQAPVRRGLFGRLRNRNTNTMSYSSPVLTAPATGVPSTPGATPMPPVAPPQAMPGAKPGAMMTPPMTSGVVQATGNLPPGTYTTTDGTIVQVGGTEMAAPATTTTSRGLFSRLRSR
ncbi:hypothetical protein [Frigoriglobus tundricola]|uniref:Uncharacterized protein n=1 Tax=Frigoriglobus tundricola TaxID=2774151 RepID=A0A6M5YZ08_9BACT|nr:hypothetical protein [Frigoriglobus tundricola]QJW98774.1 hypothetical protein FTUN_6369 [Frigoriglobus tundricola]